MCQLRVVPAQSGGLPPNLFEREADRVEVAYRKRPAFDGFVFHDYLGYRRFVDELPPAAD